MSIHPVISVQSLGKKYVIGHQAERQSYVALRDVIARSAQNASRKVADAMRMRSVAASETREDFWALRDVSFSVSPGEVVGVIGRNGAGKSTLLKILSRITEPSEGRVEIKGRVASLLEVGTGFHPELTGRENIYLNGAILGMTRSDIRRKFDEIVAFAEVERFLDTPVKRYSSGMYVRLAFAVAAHLDPEILVVDEVLAVGDQEFQKKCLGRMSEVASGGRTVLFVSHNMAAVQSMCDRAILLTQGRVSFDGPSSEAIALYSSRTGATSHFQRERNDNDGRPFIVEATLGDIQMSEDGMSRLLPVRLVLRASRPGSVNLDLRVQDNRFTPVAFATLGNTKISCPVKLEEGDSVVELSLDVSMLVVGSYWLGADVSNPYVEYYDRVDEKLTFSIEGHHWVGVIQPTRQGHAVGCVEVGMSLDAVVRVPVAAATTRTPDEVRV